MLAPTLLLTYSLITQTDGLEVVHDNVRDTTAEYYTIARLVDVPTNNLRIDILMHYHYDTVARPAVGEDEDVRFSICSSSETWQFLKYYTTILNIDGKIIPMPIETRRISRDVKNNGGVTELFHHKFPLSKLREIAQGQNVQFAIGGTSFRLSDTNKRGIAEFITRLSKSTDELKVEEEKLAQEKEQMFAKQAKENEIKQAKEKVEQDKQEGVRRDKAAQSDINMAKNYIKLGKVKPAREYIEKALRRSPSDDVRKEAETLLKSLAK